MAPSQGLPGFALGEVLDLLRTRPDIREAEAEVLRAAARLGMARSALYPRLSLGGSVLYAYNMTQNRRSNKTSFRGGPTIDIPLWDWGARQAQVKAGEQGIAAALAGYRKAVLSGVSEVEESLSALARERERIAALDEARRVLDRRNGSQRKLASLGLSSPYDGLEGRRALPLLEAQSDVALARGARTLAFVALYKALGGARWRRSLSRNSRRNSRRKSRRKSRRNNPGRCVHDRPGAQDTGLRMAALRARGAGGRLLRPDAGGAGGAGAGHFRRFGAIRERVLSLISGPAIPARKASIWPHGQRRRRNAAAHGSRGRGGRALPVGRWRLDARARRRRQRVNLSVRHCRRPRRHAVLEAAAAGPAQAPARAGAVIVDSADLESLGVAEGGKAWINGHRCAWSPRSRGCAAWAA
ncbi:TolC family protein [Achromobacter xylosoxidans]